MTGITGFNNENCVFTRTQSIDVRHCWTTPFIESSMTMKFVFGQKWRIRPYICGHVRRVPSRLLALAVGGRDEGPAGCGRGLRQRTPVPAGAHGRACRVGHEGAVTKIKILAKLLVWPYFFCRQRRWVSFPGVDTRVWYCIYTMLAFTLILSPLYKYHRSAQVAIDLDVAVAGAPPTPLCMRSTTSK